MHRFYSRQQVWDLVHIKMLHLFTYKAGNFNDPMSYCQTFKDLKYLKRQIHILKRHFYGHTPVLYLRYAVRYNTRLSSLQAVD